MGLTRKEAIDYLHNDKNYSRRLSAKLVDIAMDNRGNGLMFEALKKCLETGIEKKKKKTKFKYVIKEK